jgi:hypothetical protein
VTRRPPPSIAPVPGELWHNPKRNRVTRVETVTSRYVEHRYVDSGARLVTSTLEDFLLSFRAPSEAP